MSISQVTPATAEPVTLRDYKLHSRIESDDENVSIQSSLVSARAAVETYLRKRLVTQTIRITRDGFQCAGGAMVLPIGPVQSVAAVSYLGSDGEWTTLAASRYRLIDSSEPPMLGPAYGQVWPVPQPVPANVRIDLVVGYGAGGGAVPGDILAALRLLTAHFYENREAVVIGASVNEIPLGVRDLLAPHRLWI